MADLPPDAGSGQAEGKLEVAPVPSHRAVDVLGRIYEYFLAQFAESEKLESKIRANLKGLGF